MNWPRACPIRHAAPANRRKQSGDRRYEHSTTREFDHRKVTVRRNRRRSPSTLFSICSVASCSSSMACVTRMSNCFIAATALSSCFLGLICWLGWQLLRQNGRILLRLDELEKRLDEFEFDESTSGQREEVLTGNSEIRGAEPEIDQSLVTSAATSRFGNRSLARSKIKRDGLKAGTPAPDFRLPRLDGGELSLAELRGRRVLLVFSDPHCGPCQVLAPQLEKFHREHAEIFVVMISRGEPNENRAKVKEHRL